MFSIWKSLFTSPRQVITDIEDALQAILKLCTEHIALLTPEERNSFMDEYSRLAGAYSELSENPKYDKGLNQVLKECEALKKSIASTCRQHQEDKIRKGEVSPVTLSATSGAREPSIASVETSPYTAPSSDGSISDQSNSATTNGDSRHPPSMDTGTLSVTSNTPVDQQTISRISTRPLSVASTTAETREITSRTSTGSFSVTSNTPVIRETTSRTSTVLSMEGNPFAQRVEERECMTFDLNSSAGSPTYNIDSDGATGATHTFQGGGQSRILPRTQQRPTSIAYQQQATHVVRVRSMYVAPGATVNSPTLNVRSQNASGTIEHIS